MTNPSTLTKEIFTKLNEEHGGRLKPLRASGVDIVVRPLTRGEFDKLSSTLSRARAQGESLSAPSANAIRECLVYPSVEAFNAQLELKPGLALVFSEKLIEMAGANEEAEEITFL